jgi:hypothetical protein
MKDANRLDPAAHEIFHRCRKWRRQRSLFRSQPQNSHRASTSSFLPPIRGKFTSTVEPRPQHPEHQSGVDERDGDVSRIEQCNKSVRFVCQAKAYFRREPCRRSVLVQKSAERRCSVSAVPRPRRCRLSASPYNLWPDGELHLPSSRTILFGSGIQGRHPLLAYHPSIPIRAAAVHPEGAARNLPAATYRWRCAA